MKVENKAEFNRIFMGGILIGVIVLGIMIYLVIHILKQNKKIAESKIRMEQSRLNAEILTLQGNLACKEADLAGPV